MSLDSDGRSEMDTIVERKLSSHQKFNQKNFYNIFIIFYKKY
jgi:hypothetical protein